MTPAVLYHKHNRTITLNRLGSPNPEPYNIVEHIDSLGVNYEMSDAFYNWATQFTIFSFESEEDALLVKLAIGADKFGGDFEMNVSHGHDSLPDYMIIDGSFRITGKQDARVCLPDNLTVMRLLSINNLTVDSLPDNLTVHGNLNAMMVKRLKSFGSNTKVHGSIDLTNSTPFKFPDDLEVGGVITVTNPRFKALNPLFKDKIHIHVPGKS